MKVLRRPVEFALHTSVRMVNKLPVHPVPAGPGGHFQRIKSELGPERIRHLPANDHPREQIEDESGVDKTSGCLDIGNVSDPPAVRRRRSEVALQQVRRQLRASRTGHRGSRPLLPGPQAHDAHLAHQSLDRAPGDLNAVTPQLMPDLLRTVKFAPSFLPYPHDLSFQLLVPGTTCGRLLLSFLRRVIRGRRYFQGRAGRFHAEPVLVRIDEPD
jgi:hypothetical protein